ncbi:MAG: hypothetical protein HN400_10040 [Nitrospinaceae bacterium]|nr:hypothetical protein [Nitrospinaceae bacterium]
MEKNAILAAVLSLAVLVGWEFFYVRPQQEEALKKKQELSEKIYSARTHRVAERQEGISV